MTLSITVGLRPCVAYFLAIKSKTETQRRSNLIQTKMRSKHPGKCGSKVCFLCEITAYGKVVKGSGSYLNDLVNNFDFSSLFSFGDMNPLYKFLYYNK